VAQEGVVYFAKKTGRPILAVGAAASAGWTLKSWDAYFVPRPFAQASLVWGEPLWITPDEPSEDACGRVGAAIDRVQAEAERQAGS
jgi:lysophospholipid acyltransferase (LPLAT)-like uncharacterized protein